MSISISDVVSDWGGFEELVKEIHSTGSVIVDRDVKLEGRSGALRQIDVLMTHREGPYEYKTIIECKYWNKNIERLHVDALSTTMKEVGASKGVIFTVKGFQSGAKLQAEAEGIKLFKVRELTDTEWGKPGRTIDIWLHVIGLGIGKLDIGQTFTVQGLEPKTAKLNMQLGYENNSATPISTDKRPEKTLEELIENCVRDAARQMIKPWVFRDKDDDCNVTVQGRGQVKIEPPNPIVASVQGGVLLIPRIEIEIGVEILQSRFFFDRGKKAYFALAVEDCVTRQVYSASKFEGEEFSSFVKLNVVKQSEKDCLQNGSITQVWTTGFYNMDKFQDAEFGRMKIVG